MDKEIWKINSLTHNLPCPHCKVGILEPKKETFKSLKTKETVELEKEYRGQYPWSNFYFAGLLKCNSCGDIVTTCGLFTKDFQDIDVVEDEKTGELKLSEPDKYFYPKYFYPNLKIFNIPPTTPDKIIDCLNESFALYWSDISASINKARIAIEYLLDSQNISRFDIKKTGKKNRKKHRRSYKLSLHQRINSFKKKNNELGDYLLNVKDIGNTASHSTELKDSDLLLKIYETIEYVLINLYRKPEKIE